MDTVRTILVVDDHRAIREGLRRALADFGCETVLEAADAEAALQIALERTPGVVIADLNMPGRSGLDLVEDLQAKGVDTTVVVLTGHASIDSAVEATRRGVFDYLSKPIQPDRLKAVIARAIERTTLRRELSQLRRQMLESGRIETVVGRSAAMLEIYRLVEQVAASNASVLITGESGTGKEVVARLLHQMSHRSRGPMVAVNCAAIPATLLESELFGHEKGAFTGATSSRAGRFEQAHRGTLFLDEIGEMPVDLQSKLLRALEDRRVRRVGGDRDIDVDVRVISATNADVATLLREGRFREDLYFRLNVFLIAIPPLRQRVEDIPPLAQHFFSMHMKERPGGCTGFSEDAMKVLMAYPWPGNARELKNAVERAAILCVEGEIQVSHLPPAVRGKEPAYRGWGHGVFIPSGTSLDDAEKAIILETLRHCAGNKPRAAECLGISLKTLYTRLNKYEAEAQGTREVS